MLLCTGLLEHRESRLGPLKSTVTSNAENFLYAGCPDQSLAILAQFALEMCLAAQNRQKIHKIPYFNVQGHPRSLLSVPIAHVQLSIVINSNLTLYRTISAVSYTHLTLPTILRV